MDTIDITAYIQMIGNLGFPIVISLILLRTILGSFNKRLDSLDKRLTQLNKTMLLITRALDKQTDQAIEKETKK